MSEVIQIILLVIKQASMVKGEISAVINRPVSVMFAFVANPENKVVIGLVVFGTIYTFDQLGEPVVMRQFMPGNFNLIQVIILIINILSSFLMLIFGGIEWKRR